MIQLLFLGSFYIISVIIVFSRFNSIF